MEEFLNNLRKSLTSIEFLTREVGMDSTSLFHKLFEEVSIPCDKLKLHLEQLILAKKKKITDLSAEVARYQEILRSTNVTIHHDFEPPSTKLPLDKQIQKYTEQCTILRQHSAGIIKDYAKMHKEMLSMYQILETECPHDILLFLDDILFFQKIQAEYPVLVNHINEQLKIVTGLREQHISLTERLGINHDGNFRNITTGTCETIPLDTLVEYLFDRLISDDTIIRYFKMLRIEELDQYITTTDQNNLPLSPRFISELQNRNEEMEQILNYRQDVIKSLWKFTREIDPTATFARMEAEKIVSECFFSITSILKLRRLYFQTYDNMQLTLSKEIDNKKLEIKEVLALLPSQNIQQNYMQANHIYNTKPENYSYQVLQGLREELHSLNTQVEQWTDIQHCLNAREEAFAAYIDEVEFSKTPQASRNLTRYRNSSQYIKNKFKDWRVSREKLLAAVTAYHLKNPLIKVNQYDITHVMQQEFEAEKMQPVRYFDHNLTYIQPPASSMSSAPGRRR